VGSNRHAEGEKGEIAVGENRINGKNGKKSILDKDIFFN